jgi:hypothetical protein
MKERLFALAGLLLSGCVAGSGEARLGQTAGSAVEQPHPGRGTPTTDHHQHLFSPSLAAIVNGESPKPAIGLPSGLERLLQLRAERWNDPVALAELYAADSLVLSST